MNESQRLRLLLLIVRLLNNVKSWTGRMHIQKFVYFAQKVLGVQMGYEFVLYQRGPYSFELDADIRSLRSIGAADIVPAPAPYGPTYVVTSSGEALMSTLEEEKQGRLGELAQILGPLHARDLELLATALHVISEEPGSKEDIVARVVSLKPHFRPDEAATALEEVAEIKKQFGV